MSKYVFIVNPKSGNGVGESYGKKLEAMLPGMGVSYEVVYTSAPKDATLIASRYTKEDDCILVAAGGDGTMNEVLNGIQEGVTMAILPCGSGNDFYRLIDSHATDFKGMVEDTIYGNTELVDYGILNGYKFLGSFSIGMDANVVDRKVKIQEKNKKARKSAYLLAVAQEVFARKGSNIVLETNGTTISKSVLFVSALNARYYGGGFKAAPNADIQDGKFDVTLVDSVGLLKIAELLPKYMKGTHLGCKEVTTLLCDHFVLTCDHEIVAQCDGELFSGSTFELTVMHHGVSVVIPRGSSYSTH
ncbi:MAG: diacylglycerol kinase family lipid kinase [Erysipelotrichaceae bacterium]|nr:diacylglycerol kinase family lipid kinase [Erysipelotrichaceae bacterium]